MLVVVAPVIVFVGVLVAQALAVSQQAVPWIQEQLSNPGDLMTRLEAIPGFDRLEPYRAQILTRVGEIVGTIGSFTVNKFSSATKGTLAFGLQLVILVYAMFFFLVSGGNVLAQILDHIPLSKKEMNLIVDRFVTVTRASLISTLVVGVLQGALGGLGLWAAGIPKRVLGYIDGRAVDDPRHRRHPGVAAGIESIS
jgi:predicted PurR-regulated permease PerM